MDYMEGLLGGSSDFVLTADDESWKEGTSGTGQVLLIALYKKWQQLQVNTCMCLKSHCFQY